MKIERSEALGRDIRRDEGNELTVSTWDGVRAALREGNTGEALKAFDYGCAEAKMMHESAIKFANDALTRFSQVAKEDETWRTLKALQDPMLKRGADIAAHWQKVRADIQAGNREAALKGLDTGCAEAMAAHDAGISYADDALTHLAKTAGEDEVNTVIRARYAPVIQQWLKATPGVRESIERAVEYQRAHFGETSLREEKDRFVVTCNPCGSGGRLRRTKTVARSQQAHDWTWNKADVPLYCTHCTVMWEQLPMEIRGIPIRLNVPPKKDGDPCVHLYYKNAEDIPDEYFDRVSRSRTPAAPGTKK
jgi:hypothetical protein